MVKLNSLTCSNGSWNCWKGGERRQCPWDSRCCCGHSFKISTFKFKNVSIVTQKLTSPLVAVEEI